MPLSVLWTGLLVIHIATAAPAGEVAAQEVTTWTLNEDLRIDEEEDYYLGSAADVAVRGDRTLLVLDEEEYHVKVISPEGQLLRTIGRQGEGPGEFRDPQQLSLARGDSLYVLDGMRGLSIFTPNSYKPARRVHLPGSPEGRRFATSMMVSPEKEFLISYTALPQLGGGDPILRRIGGDGELLGVVEIPQQGKARTKIVAKNTVMPVNLPFKRWSVVAMGPEGRLYHGMTDNFAITVSDPSGQVLDQWYLPAEPRRITSDDLRAFIDDFAEGEAAVFGESLREATRLALEEALDAADLPDALPAFYDLVVDDQQRVWIRRDPAHVETATWWVASADGELLAELTLPGRVQLEAVRGGYAYGTLNGPETLPTLIRYRINKTG